MTEVCSSSLWRLEASRNQQSSCHSAASSLDWSQLSSYCVRTRPAFSACMEGESKLWCLFLFIKKSVLWGQVSILMTSFSHNHLFKGIVTWKLGLTSTHEFGQRIQFIQQLYHALCGIHSILQGLSLPRYPSFIIFYKMVLRGPGHPSAQLQ